MNRTVVSGIVAALLALVPVESSYAQAAPGANARCQASLNRCLDGANNAGQASRCRAQYESCVRRAQSSGTAYRRCMAAAKTAADKARCRSNYSN